MANEFYGGSPKTSILVGFSIINQAFRGVPLSRHELMISGFGMGMIDRRKHFQNTQFQSSFCLQHVHLRGTTCSYLFSDKPMAFAPEKSHEKSSGFPGHIHQSSTRRPRLILKSLQGTEKVLDTSRVNDHGLPALVFALRVGASISSISSPHCDRP